MTEILPFRLGIDYGKHRLKIVVIGQNGQESRASMDVAQIAELMAILSHCQYVLANSINGHQIGLPVDLTSVLRPNSGHYALGAHETLARFVVGDDPTAKEVAMLLVGGSGRITGYRTPAETARRLAGELLTSAAATEETQTKQ